MAELLKGKPVVDSMALDLRARIEALGRAKVVPALALVRVGQRPDDLSYERTARKRAESLGIAIRPYELDEFAPQAAIEAAIHEVNRDENVHGCLLFRPLPSFVDESHVCELLDPKKDIDGITLASLASVFTDGHAGLPRPRRRPRAFSCSIITRCRSRASTSWWWDAASSWASPCP